MFYEETKKKNTFVLILRKNRLYNLHQFLRLTTTEVTVLRYLNQGFTPKSFVRLLGVSSQYTYPVIRKKY